MSANVWATVVSQTHSISVERGLIALFAFCVLGFLMLWRDAHPTPLGTASRLILGGLVLRYTVLFYVFQHGPAAGAWPILWAFGELALAWLAFRMTARHHALCPKCAQYHLSHGSG